MICEAGAQRKAEPDQTEENQPPPPETPKHGARQANRHTTENHTPSCEALGPHRHIVDREVRGPEERLQVQPVQTGDHGPPLDREDSRLALDQTDGKRAKLPRRLMRDLDYNRRHADDPEGGRTGRVDSGGRARRRHLAQAGRGAVDIQGLNRVMQVWRAGRRMIG